MINRQRHQDDQNRQRAIELLVEAVFRMTAILGTIGQAKKAERMEEIALRQNWREN